MFIGSRVQDKLPGPVLEASRQVLKSLVGGKVSGEMVLEAERMAQVKASHTSPLVLIARPGKLGADFQEFFWDKAFAFLTHPLYTVSLGNLITPPPSPWLQAPDLYPQHRFSKGQLDISG